MKKQIQYDLKKLIRVLVEDKVEETWFYHVPYKKRFVLKDREEEYQYRYGSSYTQFMLEHGVHNNTCYIVENKKVYHKPYVALSFSDEIKHINTFETFDKALEWAKEIVEQAKINNLIINV
jgi:hypothetical protein